ncbi:MAG: pyruvate ferredoxin oxidoreductase [bacterium]
MKQILEGSQAIAQVIKNIRPKVVSAYPITPQTHIVEDLAKFKASGEADFEYIRAESEFAAASIVLGSSATGVRVYTATSSQGLLLMAEVIYNIAGMRLPVVLTCANRGISAPITIWNDHQDAMSVRDAGWIMFFAEDHQEAVEQHLLAYKIAEKLKIPVMINVDGFVLTHTYEEVIIPTEKEIKKFLPDYKPAKGEFLDVKNPVTFGAFTSPDYYMEIREDLHNNLLESQNVINEEYNKLKNILPEIVKEKEKEAKFQSGLIEYYGPKNPKTVLIAMGSVCGTIKDAVDEERKKISLNTVGLLKIKTFRPFPEKEVLKIISGARNVAVIEKAVSLGATDAPLTLDVKAATKNKTIAKVQGFVVGLGGRDITKEKIKKIIRDVKGSGDKMEFVK